VTVRIDWLKVVVIAAGSALLVYALEAFGVLPRIHPAATAINGVVYGLLFSADISRKRCDKLGDNDGRQGDVRR
jgi:hypothetical protein